MTREEALAKAATEWWKGKTAHEIVKFQLYEDRLCMPFDLYHEAVEEALSRPVWTHEFANMTALRAEYAGEQKPPNDPIESLERILNGEATNG